MQMGNVSVEYLILLWKVLLFEMRALVCGVFCEFVTFPLVSCVRCGTLLYRFLIFAPLLTFTRILFVQDERDILKWKDL